jgi:putative hemolysin
MRRVVLCLALLFALASCASPTGPYSSASLSDDAIARETAACARSGGEYRTNLGICVRSGGGS